MISMNGANMAKWLEHCNNIIAVLYPIPDLVLAGFLFLVCKSWTQLLSQACK